MEAFPTPHFQRMFKKLECSLQEEAFEKIELFKSNPTSTVLRTHALQGRMKGCYSFSVNYKVRIVFMYLNSSEITLISIGDHRVYDV